MKYIIELYNKYGKIGGLLTWSLNNDFTDNNGQIKYVAMRYFSDNLVNYMKDI